MARHPHAARLQSPVMALERSRFAPGSAFDPHLNVSRAGSGNAADPIPLELFEIVLRAKKAF